MSGLNVTDTASVRPSLSEKHLKALRGRGRRCVYAKGETIFSRGDLGAHIIIIEEGLVEVSLTSVGGRKSVLSHMGSGEFLGEISVLDDYPRSADVTALRVSKGIVITSAVFLDYLSESQEAMVEMIETLCHRIRNASQMFETLALTSASARLARCLLQLGEKWGKEKNGIVVVGQSFSQSELGALAGLARENVNRYIRNWALDGLISFERGHIEILDVERLEAHADAVDG